MAERLTVNPTRMEMQRQKARLRTAKRGHKLLKDKSDEMIRHFLQIVRENMRLRKTVEQKISRALSLFVDAKTQMTNQEIESALSASSSTIDFLPSSMNIMGLYVPKMTSIEILQATNRPIIRTTASFDSSISYLTKLVEELVTLAQIEKACDMLASEIVKIRRRINALEYILIPQINETIRFIRMKLAENERGQLVRIMKVKAKLEQN